MRNLFLYIFFPWAILSFQQISFAETKIPLPRGLAGIHLGQSFEEINKNFTVMVVWPQIGSRFYASFKKHDIRIAEIKASDLLTGTVKDEISPGLFFIDFIRLIFQKNHLSAIEVKYSDGLPYDWQGFIDDLLTLYGSAILIHTKVGDLKLSSEFSTVEYKWSDGLTDLKLVHGIARGVVRGLNVTYSEIGQNEKFLEIVK